MEITEEINNPQPDVANEPSNPNPDPEVLRRRFGEPDSSFANSRSSWPRGDGTFQDHVDYPAGSEARGLVAADFNGDGRLDIAVANQFIDSISVFLQPVLDTTPPAISVAVNPTILWPPNGRLVSVTVSGRITDSGSAVNPNSAAYAVTDEYGKVQPKGAIALGAGGSYSFSVLLQASRFGTDIDGRRYTVNVSASDIAGNAGSASSTVIVPHDRRR